MAGFTFRRECSLIDIRIEHLRKVFNDGTVALDGVNLTIGTGMFGLLGPNGAGKTTLMRVLSTLLEPSAGQVFFGDVNRTKQPQRVRQMIGYLPQEFGLFARLNAEEFLDLVGSMKGLPHRERATAIPGLLELVNLTAERRKALGAYSGGMKRRLGIAQALLGNPSVLIIDEPTSGLDPEEHLRFRNLISELSAQRTVLLSTHVVADVESACAQVAVLRRGKVCFTGKPSELVDLARGQVWQLALDPAELPRVQRSLNIVASRREANSAIVRVLAAANPLDRGTPLASTLEDGYLCLMREERPSYGVDQV